MLYHSKKKRVEIAKSRIAARYDLSGKPTTKEKIRRLVLIEPMWTLILRECLIVAEQRKNAGKFAGAWVVQALRAQGITPPNNLRTLTSIGLLHKEKTARGGNRAYYIVSDPKGIARALGELKHRS